MSAIQPCPNLPPPKPDFSFTEKPEGAIAQFFWRWRIWFESTFALSMLEPWEKILLCKSPLPNCSARLGRNTGSHVEILFGTPCLAEDLIFRCRMLTKILKYSDDIHPSLRYRLYRGVQVPAYTPSISQSEGGVLPMGTGGRPPCCVAVAWTCNG